MKKLKKGKMTHFRTTRPWSGLNEYTIKKIQIQDGRHKKLEDYILFV